ncbi:hypothetical protein Hamer_G013325 [Homarus americanus]|uniref:Uncharacterized protein n=1 Tax=Homarus americanus TaxID=6706 RepID=A0A8J5MZT7_HOMAM|nr:hypothetical protein Hamer_G013325 [Homarus americanus]
MTKLSQQDAIALEDKYHPKWLVEFYDRDRSTTSQKTDPTADECNTAFAELFSYMREILDIDESTPVFQLPALKNLYLSRVQQLSYSNEDKSPSFHASRFKKRILSYFSQLEEHRKGRGLTSTSRHCWNVDKKHACLMGRTRL